MGWLDRLGQTIRANINSLIQESQDPEKMLEEMVLTLEQELIRMRQGLAEAIANFKRTEREAQKHLLAAQTWYERAQFALSQNNENLARQALVKWQSYQNTAQTFETQIEQQSEIIKKLKQNLRELEEKYSQIKSQKSLYIARLKSALASQKMNEIMGNVNNGKITTVFERLESKILELEAHSEFNLPLMTIL